MKINLLQKIILTFIVILCMLSTCVLATNNTNEQSGNDILASYETNYQYTDSDLFLFDTNIEISEIVDGNVFAYGNSVKITGEIYGNLFVFANSLDIAKEAIIHGSVFTYATDITVSGIVSDIYAMSNNFSLKGNGILARNLYLNSSNVSLSGQISRDAFINTENLSFENNDKVVVKGNLNYTSKQEVQIPENSIGGTVNYTPIKTNTENLILSKIYSILTALVFSFVLIMLSIWILPNFKTRACEIISKKSFKAFGIGLLVFFGTIIASFILLISTYGFGASIAVFAIVLLILCSVISNTVFSIAIGKLLANKFNFTKNIAFVVLALVTVLVIELVKLIPYIGGPITFITTVIGLGILCINAYKRKDLVNTENN